MVQIQKSEKKAVYRYLLQEGVIVFHKDFTTQPHKGTNVPNIHVRTLLRSLKDRGLVELVFNWQYFYYFINNEGKKFLSEKDEKRQYEHIIEDRGKRVRREREGQPQGERRGGRGGPRGGERRGRDEATQPTEKPAETTTA
ncbi:uncharacterized protein LOC116245230 [Nymphaea colorata]|nr:uncharacterized protein LOC116245230 [Nymphaea colorata]